MRTLVPSTLLRRALVVDLAVSAAVGLVQFIDADALSAVLSLPRPLLVETGAFLVAYAALLAAMARAPRLATALLGLVVAGNFGWSLAALALVADRVVAPSAWGVAWLAAQAAATAVLGAWEAAGWRASLAWRPASRAA